MNSNGNNNKKLEKNSYKKKSYYFPFPFASTCELDELCVYEENWARVRDRKRV